MVHLTACMSNALAAKPAHNHKKQKQSTRNEEHSILGQSRLAAFANILLDVFSFFLTVVFIFSAGFDTPYMACWTATEPVQQLEQIQKLRLIMNYDKSMKKRR